MSFKGKRGIWKNLTEREKWMWGAFLLPVLVQIVYLLLCRYPGTLQYDFIDQLNQVVIGVYSNHHPVFYTALIAAVYHPIRRLGGSMNTVVLVFALFQILVYGQMTSYIVTTLHEAGISKRWLALILFLYVFYPYHFFFAGYMNKDSLFTYAAAVFVVAVFRTAQGMGDGKKNLAHLFLGGLGFALLRSNGFLALLATVCVLAVSRIKNKRRILYAAAAVLLCALLMKQSLKLFPQIAEVEFSESLSIPIQQVARVIHDGGKLDEAQEKLCNDLCDVSPMTGGNFVDFIRDNYNPWRSDEIKGQIQFWGRDAYFREHKGEYARLWMELGIKYPGKYFEAWKDMTSGYWSLRGGSTDYCHRPYTNDLGIGNRMLLPGVNRAVNSVLLAFQKNRVLRMFLRIAPQVWLMCLLFVAAWRQKKGLETLCVPPLALVLTLMVATPLNGEPRYVYLLYALLPFVFAIVVKTGRSGR